MRIQLDAGAFEPTRGHPTDAGLDLRTPRAFVLPAQGMETIDTGVHVEFPRGSAGMLVSKSGLNVKHGITSTGLIDAGFSGQITVKLYNHTGQPYRFEKGDKISQLVIVPVFIFPVQIVDSITEGERGDKGFGSTGR